MIVPEVRYAKSGNVNIAYQVMGDGPFDLVVVLGAVSHVEQWWEEEERASFIQRLGSFARVLMFDKRGTGLSDAVTELPDLETRMDDVRAVMDAAGSRRAAILGMSEGAPMTILFAATYPERTAAIVIWGGIVTGQPTPDTPWVRPREERLAGAAELERTWGTLEYGAQAVDRFAPSRSGDPEDARRWARWSRYGASPGAAAALVRMNINIDVRHVLPTIRVPALIVHRTGDRAVDVRNGRLMAERIPGARLVELPGDDHYPVIDPDPFLSEVEQFLTGLLAGRRVGRARAGSRPRDRALHGHRRLHAEDCGARRRALARAAERPPRARAQTAEPLSRAGARHCGRRLLRELRRAGARDPLRLRDHGFGARSRHRGAGSVASPFHIGARVAAEARPGEVLVSSAVKDLVAGSNLEFEERGFAELKGFPGEWHVFAVKGR